MLPGQSFTVRSWDDTLLACRVSGNQRSRETILWVNGLFTTASYWAFLHRDLASDYRLVTFDLRGHGDSSSPSDPQNTGIHHLARDVEAIMDQLSTGRVHLAGFSLGVQVILEAYRMFPQRVLSLMAYLGPFENPLSGIFGLPIPESVWRVLLESMANRLPRLSSTTWHALFHLPLLHPLARLCGGTNASPGMMRPFYLHQRTLDVPNGLRMALGAMRHSARDVLPGISVPTLVLAGEKDKFTPAAVSNYMRDHIPGVTFLMIEGGTHTALIEYPGIVNRTTRSFLNEMHQT